MGRHTVHQPRFRELPSPSNVWVAERILSRHHQCYSRTLVPAGRIPNIRPNWNRMSKLRITVTSLSKSGENDFRISVTFNDVRVTDPKCYAGYFSRQFVEHPKSNRAKRKLLSRMRTLPDEEAPTQFTMGDVANVIRNAEPSKAFCPDGISMIMLKYVGISS